LRCQVKFQKNGVNSHRPFLTLLLKIPPKPGKNLAGPSVKGPTVKKLALWLILGRGQVERWNRWAILAKEPACREAVGTYTKQIDYAK